MAVSSPSRFTVLLLLFISLLHGGCSDQPLTVEEQLKNLLNQAVAHLEARDLSSAMDFVDPAYSDKDGRDFRSLKTMLVGYFLRHKSIHILAKIDQIELLSEGDAEVVVFAGLAGSPQEVELGLSQWRGDLLRLKLLFVQQRDGEWRLRSAEWRRAAPQDFSL
ncbi:MAG: hypothetical protein KME56_09455 [Candidatus Thiodiazotropha sp. (ex Ctena orbiculata)]|nr:hypothetical protein [Candidatus Thiodiazotropha taylori]MBT2996847.1 hypothetical protein [Candidatus Thiodiazotropha taylori]MBT3002080.1 hypothetical protein [Candidatus Thiodiazotropha taylori]MBV2108557.1 hypothetical protein [Candidatus Thiodiazotropha taylori]MBV2109784.1 hypothetical protein [Candidatus Thiodiazotropha taylori]